MSTHNYSEHIEKTRESILEKYPEYEKMFDKVLKQRWGYMFNMMIADRDILNDYCSWLFDVLFSVFKKIDSSNYSAFEKRYVGRISELLFNVWLKKTIEDGRIKKKEILELGFDVDENMIVKVPAF